MELPAPEHPYIDLLGAIRILRRETKHAVIFKSHQCTNASRIVNTAQPEADDEIIELVRELTLGANTLTWLA